MKKTIVCCILIFCLCGCSSSTSLTYLHDELQILADAEIANLAENNKPLYRYYSSPDVGRKLSTQTSNVFMYQNEEFVMNLDIATVINSHFYDNVVPYEVNDVAILSIHDDYINSSNEVFDYDLNVYQFDNSKYFIDFQMEYVNFYSYCEYTSIDDLIFEMMKIGKTVVVDKNKIVELYSSKPTVEYIKEQVDLFDVTIPESGRIEELSGNSSNLDNALDYFEFDDDTVTTTDSDSNDSEETSTTTEE